MYEIERFELLILTMMITSKFFQSLDVILVKKNRKIISLIDKTIEIRE